MRFYLALIALLLISTTASAQRPIVKGSTDQTTYIRIIDSGDGTPETGVTSATSGIDLEYVRLGAAAVDITESDLGSASASHSDGGIYHLGGGIYRVDVPDAACSSSAGVNEFRVQGTITGMIVIPTTYPLVAYNPYDGVRLGLTSLPNASAEASGGIVTRGSGTGQLNVTGGQVTPVPQSTSVLLTGTIASVAGAEEVGVTFNVGTGTNLGLEGFTIIFYDVSTDAYFTATISAWDGSSLTFTGAGTYSPAISDTFRILPLTPTNLIAVNGDDDFDTSGAVDANVVTVEPGAINNAALANNAITNTKIATNAIGADEFDSVLINKLNDRTGCFMSGTVASVAGPGEIGVTFDKGSNSTQDFTGYSVWFYDTSGDAYYAATVDGWDGSSLTYTGAGSYTPAASDTFRIVLPAGGGSAPTVAQIADGVWDELRSGHLISGSFGEGVGLKSGAIAATNIAADAFTAAKAANDFWAEMAASLLATLDGGGESLNVRFQHLDQDISSIDIGDVQGFSEEERAQILAALSIGEETGVPSAQTWTIKRVDGKLQSLAMVPKDVGEEIDVLADFRNVLASGDAIKPKDEGGIVSIELIDDGNDGEITSDAFSDVDEASVWMNSAVRFTISGGTADQVDRIRIKVLTVDGKTLSCPCAVTVTDAGAP